MRILMVTQVAVYPPDAGPKVKTLQVLRHLAERHVVVYCTFVRSACEAESVRKHVECGRVVTVALKRSRLNDVRFGLESLVCGDAFWLRRDYRAKMAAMVRQLLSEEQIDVLYVDQLNMMRFVPADWDGRVILDEHNAVWQLLERLRDRTDNPFKRWLCGRDAKLIRQLEGEACRRADVVLAVSEQDRRALKEVTGKDAPIEVIPITVDAEGLVPIWETRAPVPGRLLTIGTMFWPPNSDGVIWWLREGYEEMRTRCPEVVYDVVGARPPGALRALAGQHTGVQVHGYVADATPFWREAVALVVPLLIGGGVRVKILEAMAMGVPVVSTTIGCEGLDVEHGVHLLIADTPGDFASACASVLEDERLAGRLARNARRLIMERYDARVVLRKLDTVLANLSYNGE